MKGKKRTLVIRICCVAAIIALAAAMMIIGRGHTIIITNEKFEHEGKMIEPVYKITAYGPDGEKFANINKPKGNLPARGSTTCMGQSFSFTVDIEAEKGGEVKRQVITLDIPYSLDGVIVNIPAYMAGLSQDVYMQEYIIAPPPEEDEEPAPAEGDMMNPEAVPTV